MYHYKPKKIQSKPPNSRKSEKQKKSIKTKILTRWFQIMYILRKWAPLNITNSEKISFVLYMSIHYCTTWTSWIFVELLLSKQYYSKFLRSQNIGAVGIWVFVFVCCVCVCGILPCLFRNCIEIVCYCWWCLFVVCHYICAVIYLPSCWKVSVCSV